MFMVVKGAFNPSPTLHHPSPSSFFRKTHYISNGSVIYYGQLQSSMMAELRYKVKGGLREVSGEKVKGEG